LVSWPGALPEGKDYSEPVSSLDVFATAVAIVGAKVPETHRLDGVNILPFLTGEKSGPPHEHLFWRTSNGAWAVRIGNLKLLNMSTPQDAVFDLAEDTGETKDLHSDRPDAVSKLKASYTTWNALNIPPIFSGPAAGRAGNSPQNKGNP
jgi:arylsulfatase A-like enzyme